MQTEEQFSPQQQRKGRVVLVLMLIFFVVPLLVVFLMYKYNWMPSGTSVGAVSYTHLCHYGYSSVSQCGDDGRYA